MTVPRWLETMRTITGITETPGSESNPKIMAMADYIGRKFPDQAAYCRSYTDDSVPWCGLCADFCMATADISGPFGATDTDKWMWALAWSDDPNYQELGQPVPGCIVVMERDGGGHVTLFEEWSGSSIKCRGGNQSDAVNVQTYDPDTVVGYYWPRSEPMPPVPRGTVSEGDSGPDVVEVQRILGLPTDGEFGPITDSGVKQYQGAYGLDKDGEVGPKTWDALDELDAKMKAGVHRISDQLASDIDDFASMMVNYEWEDRGEAPNGYYTGMCQAFAWAVQHPDDPAVVAMMAKVTNSEYDALNVYEDDLGDAGLDVSRDGIETLRALFTLMLGLGMRESSGNHWEGRDMSASNVEADTCEAGLFQTSWNISSASSAIAPLLDQFWQDPTGFRPAFDDGVSPTANNLNAYGSGDGARYQFLGKFSPLFHILVTGIGLRTRCNHWGPINRGEVEIVGVGADMLLEVQHLAEKEPEPGPDPEPEPGDPAEVTVTVETKGDVIVTVVTPEQSRSASFNQESEPEPAPSPRRQKKRQPKEKTKMKKTPTKTKTSPRAKNHKTSNRKTRRKK